jgi:hypothetical protein
MGIMGNGGTGDFVDDGGGTGRERECILEVGDVKGQGLSSADAGPLWKYKKR